jgi:hypothetical protein
LSILFSKILHQIKINAIGKTKKNKNVIGELPKAQAKRIHPITVKIPSIVHPNKNILITSLSFTIVSILHFGMDYNRQNNQILRAQFVEDYY